VSEAIEKIDTEGTPSPYESDEPEKVNLRKLRIEDNLPDVEKMTLREKSEARALARAMGENYRRRVKYYKSRLLEIPEDSSDRLWYSPEKINEYARGGSLESVMSSLADDLRWDQLQIIEEKDEEAAALVWKTVKRMAREDLSAGSFAARAILVNETPYEYAQYLVMLKAFIDAWEPRNAIERAMVETLVQAHLCYNHWLGVAMNAAVYSYNAVEQHNKREEKWQPPRLSAAETIENAMAMADRFNRLFLRTLRQMRDLRRYSVPVTINNPKQVNIAADGGQQVNAVKVEE
jgi:hypothetical protein